MKKLWLPAVTLAAVLTMASLTGCGAGNTAPIEVDGLSISTQQEGIWVSGQGEVTVTPDIATLRLGVETQADTVAEAQSQAAQAMENVVDTLESNGVADKDIQTQYYSIYPVTRWDRDDEEELITGYRVTNTINAKIRDIDKAASIIDAITLAGGDLIRISNISFSVNDPSVYYEEARELAMFNAEAKAEQLAELAGGSLGNVIYISESSYSPTTTYRADTIYEEAAVPATETPISPGETEISLSVQVGYKIEY